MKRYRIVHRTTYLYSGPVRLGPHTLRLRPREGHDLRIESSSLSLLPMGRLRWHRDVEDNCLVRATFDGVSDQLQIDSRLVILQYDHEPLDFFVDGYAVDYPFSYAPSDCPVLDAYRLSVPVDQISPLAQWTSGLWRPGEAIQSYALLKRLNLAIHQLISYRKREEPGVQTPAETLAMVSGSCRDMAFLFIEAARLLGFAARFVSGYSFTTLPAEAAGSTHAWAEVFLPGAGWKGFDPTSGGIVGDTHIAVAVGRTPESVPPIAGSFSGASLRAMEVDVRVSALEVPVGSP